MSTPEPYGESLPERLPPDLDELFMRVTRVRALRMFDPKVPPLPFDRFEAFDAKLGGMGMVIAARDPKLDRQVAIKLWSQSDARAQAALLAEARTLARLSHPNIVTVYEPGLWNGRVFFVMEWIDGRDGDDWLMTSRTWAEIRRVFMAAGYGLAAAHQAGVRHRDFKPSNVLIGADGRVVVADFGVADSLHTIAALREPGLIVGTPGYMAPERLRGGRGDARSDQFSFCVALWQAIHGVRPFPGDRPEALLEAIAAGVPEASEAAVEVPRRVRRAVRRGLAADPDQRYADMHELLRALDGRSSSDAASTAWERWRYFGLGLVTAVGLGLGFAVLRPPESSAERDWPVELAAYEVIMGLVAVDEYERAQTLWRYGVTTKSESKLSDEQLLEIGKACLERARSLSEFEHYKTAEASNMALDIGLFLQRASDKSEIRKAGSQLLSEALGMRDRLPGGRTPR